jgi:transposase
MDNGNCHTAKSLVIADKVVCLFLPPYSPEINPIERLWQDVKAQLAWLVATALDE